MTIYRQLLLWLLLAVLGALGWQLLSEYSGELVLSWGDKVYTTRVELAILAWLILWFALWALLWLVRLPFRAWRQHARKVARNRLVHGLGALHQGRWERAETLLVKASNDVLARSSALLAAIQAAQGGGRREKAIEYQVQLAKSDPLAAALFEADRLLAHDRAVDAISLLDGASQKNSLPPRGQLLRVEALAALGRAHEALALLTTLRNENALPADSLNALEVRLASASLTEAAEANALSIRWDALPRRLREQVAVVSAYARRAAMLGLEDSAAAALAAAIDAQWEQRLVSIYGELPTGHDQQRLARAEAWLEKHSESPELLVTLGKLCRERGLNGKAEEYLHRAIAQGGGSQAWEALGHVLTARTDDARATIAYANALRVSRNEAPLALTGRSLREQIADQAVSEERDEHGLPRLRG